jgi:hypothetical protein
VPNTPTDVRELRDELRHYVAKLKVEDCLHAYGTSFDVIEEQAKAGAHYFLLQINFSEKTVRVNSYSYAQLEDASADYLAAERSTGNSDAVLVSVDSVAALRRAYPNYFLDTSAFIGAVKKAIAWTVYNHEVMKPAPREMIEGPEAFTRLRSAMKVVLTVPKRAMPPSPFKKWKPKKKRSSLKA